MRIGIYSLRSLKCAFTHLKKIKNMFIIQKTYIRACSLFMFDKSINTKEATRVLKELYPEDAMTIQLANGVLSY